ncbi:T6SS immunity protein Tdi1 domain-containing protein [Amycolatopsis sp. NPDC005961]|uniref:T6SS immunity protein Tdi1 domain-containing protein n=1 Tax=Amycolatopsis sp. NPDC005961 TaxID=3156720 RepID=UPI0033E34465
MEVSGKGVSWAVCAGYQVPLFLGGADVVENLEEFDLEVYWSLCAQMWLGVGGDSREA